MSEPSLIALLANGLHSTRAPAIVDSHLALDGAEVYRRVVAGSTKIRTLLAMGGPPAKPPIVALHADRSVETLCAILAIVFADAIYLPIDPNQPRAVVEYILAEAKPTLVIGDDRHEPQLASVGSATVVRLSDVLTGSQGDLSSLPTVDESKPAYLLYTSGSSSRPKGVLGRFSGLANRIQWQCQQYPFLPDDVAGQRTPLSFVDSLCETLAPLSAGVPLVILADHDVRNVESLLAAIAEHTITRLTTVPGLLRAMLSHSDADSAMRCLRYCSVSGEALPTDVASEFVDRFPSCTLVNYYGSTEVAADVTAHRVTSEDGRRPSVPIGHPLRGVKILIAEPDLRPVPHGQIGEIVVCSDVAVAHGYLSTQGDGDNFVAGGIELDGHRRHAYRTGDLGFVENGLLFYAGRQDMVFKLAGRMVNPYLVEQRVPQATIVARTIQQVPRPVGFVPGPDSEARRAELGRSYDQARTSFPEYWIPKLYAVVDPIPRTSSGKVDRRQLEAIGLPPLRLVHGPAQRSTDAIEATLDAIISSYLGVERIGRDLRFEDAGGVSLDVAAVVARINSQFRRQISVADFYQHQTVADLALIVRWPGFSSEGCVTLVDGPATRTLYLVHAAGGLAFPYATLRGRLAGWRVVGFNSPDFGETKSYATMEELATRYLDAVVAAGDTGTVVVGGWSFGGSVAFEMARQATARRLNLAGLVLIDAIFEGDLAATETIDGRWKYLVRNGIDPQARSGRAMLTEMVYHDQLAARYRPELLDLAAVHLLKAEHGCPEPRNGWGPFLSRPLQIVYVTGEHDHLFDEPHVEGVARALLGVLNALVADRPESTTASSDRE